MRFFWSCNALILTTLNFMNMPEECTAADTSTKLMTISRTQFFRDNCYCESDFACRCCLNYNNNFLNVHQNLCGSWTIHMKKFTVGLNLALNDMVLFRNTFSGDNIPPVCFPIMPPLPIAACIKLHSLKQHENNQFHACTNASLNLMGLNMMNLRIGCIDFGLMGIELVEPNHKIDEEEAEPEISLETNDTITKLNTSTKIVKY